MGLLSSAPLTSFEIRFFVNLSCDASGHADGRAQFASMVVSTNVDGVLSCITGFAVTLTPGEVVTATARNLVTNHASEFSACVTVTTTGLLALGMAGRGPAADAGGSALFEPPPGVRDELLFVPLRLE